MSELNKKIVGKISRQYTLTADEREDFEGYDDIVAMKWDGIPNLKDEDYYVEFIDTTGRDIVQQALNIFATQNPKWDILPRGLGDIETAEKFERTLEWYMDKASQMGKKRFNSEAIMSACKYNRICGQIEWQDDYSFCVKIYHPSTVLFEYGSKLQWACVVNNVTAVSIIEHWSDYAKPNWLEKLTKGDSIGSALKKIQALVDDDEEQRMMYVDYTDEKRRYTYCYPVKNETIDDSFGFNSTEKDGMITIQDKENALGFINWAIAEGQGDPLLAPMLKANLYNNINDSETLKRTIAFRRAFFPMFIQHGREDADTATDFSGAEVVIKSPTGASLTQTVPPQLDPTFNELSAQDRSIQTNSIGISQTASLQASNVQHATLQEMIQLRLSQLDPYKKVDEQFLVQIGYLVFKWSKKKDKVLKSQRLMDGGSGKMRGTEILINPDQINLEALRIGCRILPNNETNKLQIVNSIAMLVQTDVPIPVAKYVEMIGEGDPEVMRTEWEKEQLRSAVLEAKKKEIISQVDMDIQKKMAEFQAELQVKTQMAMMQMQQPQMQGMPQEQMPQGAMPQGVAPQQGQPMPSDQMTQGQGFDAGMGGTPPQAANYGLTQAQRP